MKFAYAVPVLLAAAFAPLSEGMGGDESSLIGKEAPKIASGMWFNSSRTSLEDLKGKVVLLEFWSFGCHNCRNTLPYMNAWHKTYGGENFQVIGIHTPEFEKEKNFATLQRKIEEFGIAYPVVSDNEHETWTAYDQQYWPVIYLLDKKGTIRYMHIGEGNYTKIETQIKELLAESDGGSEKTE